MRILHLEFDQYPPAIIELLSAQCEVEKFECASQKQLYRKLQKNSYDVIFTRLGLVIDRFAMSLQPSLKLIVTPTTGLNHIDQRAAAKQSIKIISLKGETHFLETVRSTAEHSWGLILALVRSLPSAIDHVLDGGWDRSAFVAEELDGKTLGIIGFGRLGRMVAAYGTAFGMRVLAFDKNQNQFDGCVNVLPVSLNELLAQADVVILLISWSQESENFMNQEKFSLMKAGSFFVNTSRGELVDEDALLDVLKSNKLKGAALDVLRNDSAWTKEAANSPLLRYNRLANNLLITPHMGGFGRCSIAKTRAFITKKFMTEIAKSNEI